MWLSWAVFALVAPVAWPAYAALSVAKLAFQEFFFVFHQHQRTSFPDAVHSDFRLLAHLQGYRLVDLADGDGVELMIHFIEGAIVFFLLVLFDLAALFQCQLH